MSGPAALFLPDSAKHRADTQAARFLSGDTKDCGLCVSSFPVPLQKTMPQLPPHPDAGFVPYILVEEVMYRDASPWPVVEVG